VVIGLLVFSCTREVVPVVSSDEDDLIPLNLGVGLPLEGDTKASLVSGSESAVSSITLLCFNSEAGFVGKYAATLTPTNATSGTMRANIHKDTRTIHFVANRDISAYTPVIGTGEQGVLTNAALVSSDNSSIAYWGYYHNADEDAFKSYINNTGNTIQLLRDRAKIVCDEMNDSDIASIYWIATNGLSEGYLAPYPFANYWVDTEVTPKENAARHVATEDNMVDFSSAPLYLFEDYNSFHQLENLVKIILKVTYNDATVRFHNIVMLDDDYVPLPIKRNHTYKLTIENLPKELGFDSFDKALAAGIYSNNQTVAIDRAVATITDGTYTLDIPTGTTILYQEPVAGGTVSIPFSYLSNGDPEAGRTSSDFVVMWLEHDNAITASAETPPGLTYNTSTGSGNISLTLSPLSSSLKQGLILLQDKKHGLSRFIEVYSITQFPLYSVSLTSSGVRSRGGDSNVPVYRLSFVLPADYPTAKYPIQLSIASSTLSPFSNSSSTSASGNFGVEVRTTEDLTSSASSSDWNYGASGWDYWYVYSIPAPAGDSVSARTVTIYLDDIRYKLLSSAPSGVGLYLSLPYFGDPIPVTPSP
jgi:hypothetical protein